MFMLAVAEPTTGTCPSQSVTFYEPYYDYISHQVREDFVAVGLLAGLYGVLTILSLFSIYSFTQRSKMIQPSTIVLSFMTLALFTSTTTYMIICLLSYYYAIMRIVITSVLLLWEYSIPMNFPNEPLETAQAFKYALLQSCAGTATLTLNVVLGDAIVCWRACVVWHDNRVVKALCTSLLLATCGFYVVVGIVDTVTGCSHPDDSTLSVNLYSYVPRGTMFQGIPIGITACVLSLSTNLFATLMMAYKAWRSRRRLRDYLAAGQGRSQVQKVLALLVESGAVYCAVWVIIVAFQVKNYAQVEIPATAGFIDVFGIFMSGVLVPVIAIYPTIIIVLVALNKSHMEKGLTQNIESMPTPYIAVTVDRSIHSRHGSTSHSSRISDILVTDGREDDVEDTSEHAAEEQKLERIIEE